MLVQPVWTGVAPVSRVPTGQDLRACGPAGEDAHEGHEQDKDVPSFSMYVERNADDHQDDTDRSTQKNNEQHTTSTSGSEEGAMASVEPMACTVASGVASLGLSLPGTGNN